MKRHPCTRLTLIAFLVAVALSSCRTDGPSGLTDPPLSSTALDPLHRSTTERSPRTFLRCVSEETELGSVTVGPRGGSFELGGNGIDVPRGAVAGRVRLTFSRPAGPILQLDIRANGTDHYSFEKPVAVTISYADCPRQRKMTTLGVWYVDPRTGEPIEFMGGTNDPSARTVTFLTTHLSTYAVAH